MSGGVPAKQIKKFDEYVEDRKRMNEIALEKANTENITSEYIKEKWQKFTGEKR